MTTARWILLVALPLAALAWTTAWAEDAAAAAETAKAPAPTKVVVKKVAHPSRRKEDARHCLELKGNFAIIKCAEQYL